jgi:hypothetical protein
MYGIVADLSRNVKASAHDCYHSACSLITTIVHWSALVILHQYRLGHYPWYHYYCMTTKIRDMHLRHGAAQRLALAAWWEDQPTKRKNASRLNQLKSHGPPPSPPARIVRLGFMAADSLRAFDRVVIMVFANILVFTSDTKTSFRKQLSIRCQT